MQARTLPINAHFIALLKAATLSNHRRPTVAGSSIIFIPALANRKCRVRKDDIDVLRMAVLQMWAKRPFTIDAWVKLQGHLHRVWTVPAGPLCPLCATRRVGE